MANWKEDMISRIQEERLEKEIKDMEVDFTKHREEINQEFDNLCKDIVELDYDSSIHMEKIDEVDKPSRRLTVLGIDFWLSIKKHEISIECSENHKSGGYEFNFSIGKQTYQVFVGKDGSKYYKYLSDYYLNENDKSINPPFQSKELDRKDFDYNKILDTLMDKVYTEIKKDREDLEIKSIQEKARQTIADKGFEDLLNSTDFRNQ